MTRIWLDKTWKDRDSYGSASGTKTRRLLLWEGAGGMLKAEITVFTSKDGEAWQWSLSRWNADKDGFYSVISYVGEEGPPPPNLSAKMAEWEQLATRLLDGK
jgi:hypothetical protein